MIEIIPAMDLIGGRCVRLLQGDFNKETVYSDDPVGVARAFADAGIRRLHMVDLDGARRGSSSNIDILKAVSTSCSLSIDFGGGVRSANNVRVILDSGAAMVTIGSLAVREPEKIRAWAIEFGIDKFMIGIDIRDGRAAVNGWYQDTEKGVAEVLSSLIPAGLRRYFVTDIAKDGAMEGPALDLYRGIIAEFPEIELIASGGVRTMQDISDLDEIGCSGVIVGRAIYEATITTEEAAKYAG